MGRAGWSRRKSRSSGAAAEAGAGGCGAGRGWRAGGRAVHATSGGGRCWCRLAGCMRAGLRQGLACCGCGRRVTARHVHRTGREADKGWPLPRERCTGAGCGAATAWGKLYCNTACRLQHCAAAHADLCQRVACGAGRGDTGRQGVRVMGRVSGCV